MVFVQTAAELLTAVVSLNHVIYIYRHLHDSQHHSFITLIIIL